MRGTIIVDNDLSIINSSTRHDFKFCVANSRSILNLNTYFRN